MHFTSSVSFFFLLLFAATLLLALPLRLLQLKAFANFPKAECDIEFEWTGCMEAGDKVNGWEQNRLNRDKTEDVAAHKAGRATLTGENIHRVAFAALGVACALCAVQSYAVFFALPWKVVRVSVLFNPHLVIRLWWTHRGLFYWNVWNEKKKKIYVHANGILKSSCPQATSNQEVVI